MSRRRIALAVALSLLWAPALAQDGGGVPAPLAFQAKATPDKVRLGEPFVYTVAITHPASQRYELAMPQDLGPFEVTEVQRHREDGKDGRATTTFELKMALFDLGSKTLPELPFEVVDEAKAGRFAVPGSPVEGVSSLPADADKEGADLYDIKPPLEVPVRSYRLLWALLIGLGVAALAYGAYRFWKRPRALVVPVVPPQPLDVRTRAALDALRAEDLPSKGRARELHFRLSEIVRGYLGERYAFEALERTSPELLDSIRRLPTPGLPVDDLIAFVYASDLVKFAKSEATPDDCKRAMDFGYLLLDRTWPPPPPPAPAAPPLPHAAGTLVP